jgi:peptidoglycan/LPS O-acetylase OafA/YrhL
MGRPEHGNETVAYRADIDGLRAISILLVVGYHAQLGPIPGGFVGVDVFFVISGFLISGIIFRELEAGTFSPVTFYARRIRRIFPALIVVLAVTYLIGWFVLLPGPFSLLGQNTAAGVAFVSNLFQLSQLGYFAPDAAENPLLHLWSLGIEEQFYIFWPPLLWALFGSRRRGLWIAALAAASFGASLMIFFGYKEWSFYSPISRAWELLAGGMVGIRMIGDPKRRQRNPARRDDLLASIGLAAILGAAIGLGKDSLFPGAYALLPVLGAVLMIVSPNSLVNRIWLSSRPMVLIGLISYPLYLWHWPLLAYLGILRNGDPTLLELWLALVVAAVLAWLTYRFIEIPLRRSHHAVPRLSFALAAVGLVGMVTAAGAGLGFRFPPEIREIAQLPLHNNAGLRDMCFLEPEGSRFDSNCIEPGDKPLLFLWGDSTAAALLPGLKQVQATTPFRLAHFAAPACAPVLATGSNNRCDEANDTVLGFIKSSHPDIVLLHAMWQGSHNLGKLEATLGELDATIQTLKALRIPRIVILGPVPVWKRTLPHALVNYYRLTHVVADRLTVGASGPQGDELMQRFSGEAGVEYISAWHALCNADGCLARAGPHANDVTTSDLVHLSDAGSVFLIEAIEADLFPRSLTLPGPGRSELRSFELLRSRQGRFSDRPGGMSAARRE